MAEGWSLIASRFSFLSPVFDCLGELRAVSRRGGDHANLRVLGA
jgi:hypothetical protein